MNEFAKELKNLTIVNAVVQCPARLMPMIIDISMKRVCVCVLVTCSPQPPT